MVLEQITGVFIQRCRGFGGPAVLEVLMRVTLMGWLEFLRGSVIQGVLELLQGLQAPLKGGLNGFQDSLKGSSIFEYFFGR